MSDRDLTATRNTNESRIYRDYRSKQTDAEVRHGGESRRIDIACKMALALAEHPLWDDETIIFDKVLAVIEALEQDGFVLGRWGCDSGS